MAYPRQLPMTAVLVVLALTNGQGKPFAHPQVATFVGTWAFTMTEPEALKGSQQTMKISVKGDALRASVQIGKFPPLEATGVYRDGDMLVLTLGHAAGLRENGAPIWAVISLTLDGDTMKTAQMLERSQTIKRGLGKKQPD